MIALVLGGSPSVWSDLAEAEALLGRRHMVVAANLAGIHFEGRLDGWATLHPDLLPGWAAKRAGEPAGRLFTPPTTAERWSGSSGLYAAQCALFEMGATAVILCGVPMDQAAGHFENPGAWAETGDYRRAFAAALPLIGGRTRSMDGWTRDLFGAPTGPWVDAVHNIRPLGATRAPSEEHAMHHVRNTSDKTQTFWAPDGVTGQNRLVRLEPGKGGDYAIDPAQPRFAKGGAFAVSTPRVDAFPPAPAKA